jgi:hypothetical protein
VLIELFVYRDKRLEQTLPRTMFKCGESQFDRLNFDEVDGGNAIYFTAVSLKPQESRIPVVIYSRKAV